MLPSQLQYKDVITRVLPGFLFCIVITFFFIYFFPVSEEKFKSWPLIDWKEFLLLFLPITLAVSYAIGTAIGSIHVLFINITYQYPMEEQVDGGKWIYKFTWFLYRYIFWLNKKETEKDPRFVPLLNEDIEHYIELRKRINKKLGYNLENQIKSFHKYTNRQPLTRIFDSCMNYNRTVSSSSAVSEIYRYSIITEFNAQMSIIFMLCFWGSIISIILLFVYHKLHPWNDRSLYICLVFASCFFYYTRKCANKSVRDWRERCAMIYHTFYFLSVIEDQKNEEKSKGLENSEEN
jgi:hypothetical protein